MISCCERSSGEGLRAGQRAHVYVFMLSVLLVAVFVWSRAVTLAHFRIYDEDQALLWYTARELLQGRFHEPNFYGQLYNTYFEAVVALPFLLIGFELPVALAWATTFCSYVPFVLIAAFAARIGRPLLVLCILMIPLSLPVPFHLLSSMPRGFFTGLPFAVVAFITAYTARSAWTFGIAAFLYCLAVETNPNSLLLIIPTAPLVLGQFLRLPTSVRSTLVWKALLGASAGLALGALLHIKRAQFYAERPHYNLFWMPDPKFVWSFLLDALGRPGDFLQDVLPFGIPALPVAIILVSLIVLTLVRGQIWFAASVAGFLAMILVSLGFDRIHGGQTGVWMSYARMFVAVPYVLAILCATFPAQGGATLGASRNLVIRATLLTISIVLLTVLQYASVKERIVHVLQRPFAAVIPQSWDVIRSTCDEIDMLARRESVKVVVGMDDMKRSFWYGCAALLHGRVTIIHPSFDRRTWLLLNEDSQPRKRILVYDDGALPEQQADAVESGGVRIERLKDYPQYSVVKSRTPISSVKLAERAGIKFRRFRPDSKASPST